MVQYKLCGAGKNVIFNKTAVLTAWQGSSAYIFARDNRDYGHMQTNKTLTTQISDMQENSNIKAFLQII